MIPSLWTPSMLTQTQAADPNRLWQPRSASCDVQRHSHEYAYAYLVFRPQIQQESQCERAAARACNRNEDLIKMTFLLKIGVRLRPTGRHPALWKQSAFNFMATAYFAPHKYPPKTPEKHSQVFHSRRFSVSECKVGAILRRIRSA